MNKQKGIALPVALIMFVVMAVGAIYLARSASSASVMVGNLSYQRSLSRTSDLGLLTGYDWLVATHADAALVAQLNGDVAAQGYVASFSYADPQVTPADAAFWVGSRTVTNIGGTGDDVEYIVHRLCSLKQAFSAAGNRCITSSFEAAGAGTTVNTSLGTSNEEAMVTVPLIHYLITARVINTRKNTSVVNQMTVMMGA